MLEAEHSRKELEWRELGAVVIPLQTPIASLELKGRGHTWRSPQLIDCTPAGSYVQQGLFFFFFLFIISFTTWICPARWKYRRSRCTG